MGLLLILASGSRTSLMTGLAGIMALIVMTRWPEPWRITKAHAGAALILLIGGVALAVPYVGFDEDRFTGRAGLWKIAQQQIAGDPGRVLWGAGPESWSSLFERGVIDLASAYSAHNQFLTVVFIAGVVGLLLLLLALGVSLARNWLAPTAFVAAMVPALVTCVTERPWALERPDWLVWNLCALISMAPLFRAFTSTEEIPSVLPHPEQESHV